MELKIGVSNPIQGTSRYGAVKKTDAKTQIIKPESDKLEVSALSRSFAEALSAAKEAPEFREARVDDLRARIQNGSYQVNAREISDKLLSGVLGL